MNLKDLLTLYCEQQEATGYSIQTDHEREAEGKYPIAKITISVHYSTDWGQRRSPEFKDFYSEEEAITELQKLTSLNKAIA